MFQPPRSPPLAPWLKVALVAALAQLALMAAYAARFGGDPSSFVCAPYRAVGRWPTDTVRVGLSEEGHDGQWCFVIARSPFTAQDPQFVSPPAMRHMRVLYPALAWALSGFGDPEALLWALPAVNLIAIAVLAGLGAVFAGAHGRSPWWGLAVPLAMGAPAPALRDLTDPVSSAALLGLAAAWMLRWNPVSLGLWAAAAVFAREQNAAAGGIVLLVAAAGRDWRRAGAVALALGLWWLWVRHVRATYGASPFEMVNIAAPFMGVRLPLEALAGDAPLHRKVLHGASLAWLGSMGVIALAMPFLKAGPVPSLLALAGAGLAALGGPIIYEDWYSYTRVFAFLSLGVLLWTLASGRKWPWLAMAPAALWPAYALVAVWSR